MRRIHIEAAALAGLLAAGCGGGGSGPSPAPSLTIEPGEWSVPAGGPPRQFTATLTGSSDPVAWSLEPPGPAAEVGTISATGLYTPPPALEVGRDVLVEAAAGTLVAHASVHVGAGLDGVTLVVTPGAGSVVAGSGDTVSLHAETNFAGSVQWTLAPELGALDATSGPDVLYAAPAGLVTATAEVIVTAQAGALSDPTSIAVHPTALRLTGPASVRAGGDPVAFTITTDVGAAAVAWSVTPPGVGAILGTGPTGTFTPAATVDAATPFQVLAAIGEATGSASSTLLPPAAPITVAGRVSDERGAGVEGATVVVGAQSTTTGPDGAFTLPSVVPPYDATVIAEGGTTVDVYRGLVAAAPVLWYVAEHGPGRSATVSGRVTRAGEPAPGARVFGPSVWAWATGSGGEYSLFVPWTGEAATILPLRALLTALDAGFRPSGYWFGSRSVAVSDGGAVSGADIDVAESFSGTVTGSTIPSGDTDLSTSVLTMVARFTDGAALTIHDEGFTLLDPLVGPFGVVVPALPDAAVRLGYAASGTSGGRAHATARVAPGDGGVSLELPAIPVATGPQEAASGAGYATSLTWTTPNPGGSSLASVRCGNGVSYRIHGAAGAATIPDLSAHGVVLAPGIPCTWSPAWASYGVAELVLGPAAVEALTLERGASGAVRSFTF